MVVVVLVVAVAEVFVSPWYGAVQHYQPGSSNGATTGTGITTGTTNTGRRIHSGPPNITRQ
jgi:hypothetical protein